MDVSSEESDRFRSNYRLDGISAHLGADSSEKTLIQEKWVTEDEMVREHHQLNGHESKQTPGDSEGQGSPMHCSPWNCKVRYNLAMEQQCILPGKQSRGGLGESGVLPLVLRGRWRFFLTGIP